MNTKQSIVEYVKLINSQNGVWSAMGSFNIKTTDYMILQLCKMTLELSSEVERLRVAVESNTSIASPPESQASAGAQAIPNKPENKS